MERTDVHAPSAIIPSDYEYVAQEVFPHAEMIDAAVCGIVLRHREIIRKHMERTGGTYSGHEHGGNCGVCGSVNAIYTILFYHAKTNSYVRMGQDCAEKCEMGNDDAFQSFREGVKAELAAKAGKKKAKLLLEEKGMEAAWTIYEEGAGKSNDRFIVVDMVGKLVRYGSLSEPQLGFLKKLLERIAKQPEIDAQRAAERALAKDCPSGRVTVTGTILTVKSQESPFGIQIKMLVKSDEGYCVWGTHPSGLGGWADENGFTLAADKGDRVQFSAVLEPSADDVKFGYFKRPTKAEILSQVIKRPEVKK